jgi:signal transduction histidine kinase
MSKERKDQQSEQFQRLEREMREAVGSISAHQQMLAEKYDSPTFRASLDQTLAKSIKCILRLANRMRFLAKEMVGLSDSIPLEGLLDEAFQEAQSHHRAKAGTLVFEKPPEALMLSGDRAALKEALAEIILNAFQANPAQPWVRARARSDTDANGTTWVDLQVQSSGKALPPEMVQRASETVITAKLSFPMGNDANGTEGTKERGSDQPQQPLLETPRSRFPKAVVARLSNQIRNPLVLFAVHQQMLANKYESPTFRASLEQALAEGVKHILRPLDQMKFLAMDKAERRDSISLEPLLEDAFQEAQSHHSVQASTVIFEKTPKPVILSGDRDALKHALAEVLLNALQATREKQEVRVRPQIDTDFAGMPWVHIDVQDSGKGFTPDTARKAEEAFFASPCGIGLGLAVCRHILDLHGGNLKIVPAAPGQAGFVCLSLPLAPASTASQDSRG